MADAAGVGTVLERDPQIERQEQRWEGAQQRLRRNQGYKDT
jgi:hypothetical protein